MVQMKNKRDISRADIYVDVLPENMIESKSSTPLYCIKINDKILRTPYSAILAHENERAIRALAAELDYTDILDVNKFSLYHLFCNQIDFFENIKKGFSKEMLAEFVWNDIVLRPVNGPEVVEQFKYLTEVQKFLDQNKLEYPFIMQIPFENAVEQGFLKGYKKFDKIVSYLKKQISELSPQQLTVFIAVVNLYKSPTLGLMLVQNKVNALEFATTCLAMEAVSSKVWGGDRGEEKSFLDNCTKNADIMLRYLSLFTLKATTPLKVFLCYSSGDQPAARKLYKQLLKEKWIKPWLNKIDLLPGTEWDFEIKKVINESHAVIVFLSEESTKKEGYIQKEIKHTLDVAEEKPDGTIFIVPIKLEECVVPPRLQKYHWLEYYEEASYTKLLNSLRTRADKLELQTF